MDRVFEKYPEVEIVADAAADAAADPAYRVSYLECVKEGNLYRFIKKKAVVPRNKIESLVSFLIREVESRGG